MNISDNIGINFVSGSALIGGGGIDEEHRRIMEKLRALGITPTGNKTTDKAKLREIELQQVKNEIGAKGNGTINPAKFITVSASEIEKLKENRKAKAKEEEKFAAENEEKQEMAQNRIGAEQAALLNRYFIKKRKS